MARLGMERMGKARRDKAGNQELITESNVNISDITQSYENATLGAYLNSLDEHDIYQMAVNGEYAELCKIAERLFRVIPPACVEAFEALLWTAAESIINSRVDDDDRQ